MKKIFIGIIGVVVLIFLIFTLILQYQQYLINKLEGHVEKLKESYIPLRFMVLSRSDASISARFRFYNADGKELAMFEQSWRGSELTIDSLVIPLADTTIVFPVRVFTDAIPPRSGTILFHYYDHSGMPAIYESISLPDETRTLIKKLFNQVKIYEGLVSEEKKTHKEKPVVGLFGNAVHDIQQVRKFEVGTIYALVVHTAHGGIEIIRE